MDQWKSVSWKGCCITCITMEFGQTFTFILSKPPSLQDDSMFEGWQMVLSRKTKKCCGSWKFMLFHDNKNPHKDLHYHAFSLLTVHQPLLQRCGDYSISPAFLNPNWFKMQSTNMQCTNPQSRRSRYPPWETSLERCLNRWHWDSCGNWQHSVTKKATYSIVQGSKLSAIKFLWSRVHRIHNSSSIWNLKYFELPDWFRFPHGLCADRLSSTSFGWLIRDAFAPPSLLEGPINIDVRQCWFSKKSCPKLQNLHGYTWMISLGSI